MDVFVICMTVFGISLVFLVVHFEHREYERHIKNIEKHFDSLLNENSALMKRCYELEERIKNGSNPTNS